LMRSIGSIWTAILSGMLVSGGSVSLYVQMA
jgi:hypothetical protein